MSAKRIYQFHKLFVQTDDVLAGGFWSFWRWKLDPYKSAFRDQAPDLNITSARNWDPLGPWEKKSNHEAGFFFIQTYYNSQGETLLEYGRRATEEKYVRLWMSADYSEIRLLYDNSETSGALPFELIGWLMPQALLKHNVITLHGVLMEHEGRGIILSAPSGIGKTTHARLWRDTRNALIINGDRATCSLEEGRWVGFGLPWSGSSGEQINRSVPIAAMVVLRQDIENHVQQLEGLEKFEAFMSNLLYPSWDRKMTEKALDMADAFLSEIPVLRLQCRPDSGAVEVLECALRKL